MHKEKLYAGNSNYFTWKRCPVPKEIDGEINKYICKNVKLSIGPEVFVCARYVFSQIYTKKEILPIVSPIKSISDIQKEFETVEEEIDLEMDNMERGFEKERKKKIDAEEKIVRIVRWKDQFVI